MAAALVRPLFPCALFRSKATGFNSLLDGAVRRVRIQGSSPPSGQGRTAEPPAGDRPPPLPSGDAESCRVTIRQHATIAPFPAGAAKVVCHPATPGGLG